MCAAIFVPLQTVETRSRVMWCEMNRLLVTLRMLRLAARRVAHILFLSVARLTPLVHRMSVLLWDGGGGRSDGTPVGSSPSSA